MAQDVYSFQDVTGQLIGPAGSVNLGNGSGAAEEGITIDYVDDKATMTIGADGRGMHSLHAGRAATVTIRLLKTSETNARMNALYNAETISAALYGQDTIVFRDPQRGDIITCNQCGLRKHPATAYAKVGNVNEWIFNSIRVDKVLGTGRPTA